MISQEDTQTPIIYVVVSTDSLAHLQEPVGETKLIMTISQQLQGVTS